MAKLRRLSKKSGRVKDHIAKEREDKRAGGGNEPREGEK
jgi:hypothetical protein